MRAALAAAVVAVFGAGCCKTCGWCRDDDAPRAGYTSDREPLPVPAAGSGGGTGQTLPAAPPAPRPATGAYGGTGN